MKNDFHKILRDRRKRLGISQEELAKKADIERTYMSKLENEKSNPSFSTIKNLCKGLNLTLTEFFSGIEEEKKEPTIVIYEDTEDRDEAEKYRIKAEVIPIKVVKNLNGFSRGRDIKKEFTSKYVYIEKEMFDKPDDIVGVEIAKEFVISDLKLKKPILLIDIVNKDITSHYLYIVDPGDKEKVSIQWGVSWEKYIAFYDPHKYQREQPISHVFKKNNFEPDIIRGKVVGVISRL